MMDFLGFVLTTFEWHLEIVAVHWCRPIRLSESPRADCMELGTRLECSHELRKIPEIPMTDPWCCYIWCSMDPINVSPIYVSIYSSTMDPSWDMERDSEIHGLMNHGFDEHPRFVHSSRAADHVPRQTSRVYDLGSPKLTPTGHIQKERPAS